MNDYDLIIVGAGPKGIALAAKHWALKNRSISYLIIERGKVGSNWLGGKAGYTDGKQRLVTLPEHDVGFPYASDSDSVNATMQLVSWEAYQVRKKLRTTYVVHEEKHPTHTEFVDYLSWVKDEVSTNIVKTSIKPNKIDIRNDRWWIQTSHGSTKSSEGLVITGHGGPKRLGGRTYKHKNISDWRNFWQRMQAYERVKPGQKIAVIGQGETAGAIALAILNILKRRECDTWDSPAKIHLICRQSGYFPRSQIEQDLRYFSEPGEWAEEGVLLVPQRRAIMNRADRGVVSPAVKHSLESSELVAYTTAEADWPDHYRVPTSGPLMLKLTYGRDEEKESATDDFAYVVSALGFDDLWFLDLFSTAARRSFLSHILQQQKKADLVAIRDDLKLRKNAAAERILDLLTQPRHYRSPKPNGWLRRRIEKLITTDLSVDGFIPRLHLPRFAGLRQGPGIPNLNCLGLMSDMIWSWYHK